MIAQGKPRFVTIGLAESFSVCSHAAMTYRVADSELALTLEVALSGAPSFMVADLQHHDRHRRSAAVAALASHLAARMRCYEVIGAEPHASDHPSLFEGA
jgi:hypothetical protein